MEQGLSRNVLVSMLTKSPHGDLAQYAPIATQAVEQDPGFFARLIAWNEKRGSIRDAKVALPVMALTADGTVLDPELRDNALAHIALLDPRNLLRAVRFSMGQPVKAKRMVWRLVERYLREREASPGKFDRVALQHRKSLVELYALLHIKPSTYANDVLFAGKKDGVFGLVARLKDMDPAEAAGTIMERRIPFLVAQGAMGAKFKDPAVVQALIEVMSPTEIATNMNALKKLGVETNPALRGALAQAMERVTESKSNQATLKTSKAAAAVGGAMGERLKAVQEKQLDKLGVKGNWLVLGDVSGSMAASIEVGRQVSAILARVAEGDVHLVFFNTAPSYFNVTGKTLEQITELTKRQVAGGGTLPGAAVQFAIDRNLDVDGVVVVGDGNENHASFVEPYKRLCEKLGKDLPVYMYQLAGDPPTMLDACKRAGVDVQTFDLRSGVDFYALPNVISTMRVQRHDLGQEILETPLLTLADVFKLAA